MAAPESQRSVKAILAKVKKLAAEYYDLTGKPFGVTGEIAEYEAAEKLGLELCDARTEGYDAIRQTKRGIEKVQIKGRRRPEPPLYRGRVPKINLDAQFDTVALVLLDAQYNALEIWEASRDAVQDRLRAPGSKARNERNSMGISQFRSIATRIWPL